MPRSAARCLCFAHHVLRRCGAKLAFAESAVFRFCAAAPRPSRLAPTQPAMGKAGKRRSTMPVYILAILLLYLYFCYLLVVRRPQPPHARPSAAMRPCARLHGPTIPMLCPCSGQHGLPMLRSTSRHVRSRAVAEMVTMHIFFAATIVCLLLACCVEPGTVPHEQVRRRGPSAGAERDPHPPPSWLRRRRAAVGPRRAFQRRHEHPGEEGGRPAPFLPDVRHVQARQDAPRQPDRPVRLSRGLRPRPPL